MNAVQKSGCNGFTDDEIFGMAVHFWDEDDIQIGNSINCNVVVNHTVILTEQEKEQARKEAIDRVHNEAYNKMKQPIKKTAIKKNEVTNQLSLF